MRGVRFRVRPLTELTPAQAYERFQQQRARVSAVKFFNDPGAAKLHVYGRRLILAERMKRSSWSASSSSMRNRHTNGTLYSSRMAHAAYFRSPRRNSLVGEGGASTVMLKTAVAPQLHRSRGSLGLSMVRSGLETR